MTVRERITGVGARRLSIYVTIFVTQLGVSVAVPVLPELRDQFGVTVAAVSLTTAMWGLARLVMDLPVGRFTARFSSNRLLFVAILLLGVGAATSAFAPTFEILLLGRVISGAGAAIFAITATLALLALSTPLNKGRVLGIYQAALQAGASFSPIVAGFASQLFGWRAAFMVAGLGALGGLLVLVFSGAGRESAPKTAAEPTELPSHARKSPVWLDLALANVATFVLFFLTGGIAQNVLPLYGDKLGLDAAGIGLILGIATMMRVVVSVIGSLVSDRTGRHIVLFTGFVLTLISLLIFPLVTNVVGFTLLAWLMSIGRVGNTVPIAVISDRLPEKELGRWISRNRFVADLALLIGPIVLGVIIDAAGFDLAFYIAAVLVFGVLMLMLVEWRANRAAKLAAA